MAHIRQSIRDNAVTAVTGLSANHCYFLLFLAVPECRPSNKIIARFLHD